MHIHLIIGHDRIFGGEKPKVSELLDGIPSKYVIGFLSIASNTIERKGDTRETQWELLDAMSINFPSTLQDEILKRLRAFEDDKGSFTVFANRYIVEMIQREYLQFRSEESEKFRQDPGSVELSIFKAYTITVDEVAIQDNVGLAERLEEAKKYPDSELYRVIWPYYAKQFEFSIGPDYILEGLKGMAFLNFLSNSSKYQRNAQHFFQQMTKAAIQECH